MKKKKLIKVYRLENYKGRGPFSGSQRMALQLISHTDPEKMISSISLSKEEFERFTSKGYVFGWKTKDLTGKFFRNKKKAPQVASQMKMKISIYSTNWYIEFPDGQILFKRPKTIDKKVSVKDFLNLETIPCLTTLV